jgi:hypothetical protein
MTSTRPQAIYGSLCSVIAKWQKRKKREMELADIKIEEYTKKRDEVAKMMGYVVKNKNITYDKGTDKRIR